MIDRKNFHTRARGLTDGLLGKGRRRREVLKGLAKPGVTTRTPRNDMLPSLEIIYLPLDDLRSAPRRLRHRDPAHVGEVAATISALGFCDPIFIGKGNLVIDGEDRLEAAKLLGLGGAPCVRIDHLSSEEQRLLRLAVNRLAEKGQWDLDELKIEFEELILADAPIEISGFALDEIDQIVIGDDLEAVKQGPLEPDPSPIGVARLGDVFQLGPHHLICGDATDPSLGSDARRGLRDHPTVKPTAMLEDALLDLTNRGEIVLDPFLGSGSTLIAADKIGRICRGVELDPLYIDVIIRRYMAATGEAAVLAGTDEVFADLASRRVMERAPDAV